MIRLRFILTSLAALGSLLLLCLLADFPASALNYGSGTYGACQYGTCGITISSNGNVSLNVTLSPSGNCTIQKDVVTVTTDDSSGFTLTLIDNSADNSLISGANSISATSASQASPATLGTNRWGYRVDGLGSFGSGPTSAQSNISSSSLTFAAVPLSTSSADTIATTNTAAGSEVDTNVWYGVCADTSTHSGTYTSQVTYTAVTN